jgi:hypothetical protein
MIVQTQVPGPHGPDVLKRRRIVDTVPYGVSVALKVLVRIVGRFFLEQPVVHRTSVIWILPIVIVSPREEPSGMDLGKATPIRPDPVAWPVAAGCVAPARFPFGN